MEDDDWTPPSAADMKIIEARHERSNQISKLMGAYMLKGYRMLDKICHCGTILLQDRNGEDYCVACRELESECAKDDPVLSSEAARVAVAEGQAVASNSIVGRHRMALYQAEEPEPQHRETSGHGDAMTRTEAMTDARATHMATSSAVADVRAVCAITSTTAELQNQIEMAAKELKDCASLEMKIQLCNLIKAASEALTAVQNAGLSE